MSIRTRTFVSITMTMLLFIGGLYIFSQKLLLEGFAKLESREAFLNLERISNVVLQEADFVGAKNTDWGAWTDTWTYLEDRNKAYEEANVINETASNMGVNYVIFYDTKNIVVNSVGWDLEKNQALALNEDIISQIAQYGDFYFTHKDESDLKKGLINTAQGPAIVTSHPIVTGEKKGPIRGTLLILKFLTPSLIKTFSEVSKFPLEKMNVDLLKSAGSQWATALELNGNKLAKLKIADKNLVNGFQLFKDVKNNPIFVLKVDFQREVMHQGSTTISSLIYSIIGFGLFIGIFLLLLLEKSVISRVVKLTKKVEEIGNQEKTERVEVTGKDEITYLSTSINGMLDSIDERKRAIQTIMDNVDFGLMRCDKSGKILSGFSNSCLLLFEQSQRSNIQNHYIWDALKLSPRDAENFQILYEQVTEDSLLAEELVRQIPNRFEFNDKSLSLFGSVILNTKGDIESVLFTIADITALVKAEKENEINQALLKILQSKDRFTELVERVFSDQTNDLIHIKRNLHTWKGDFSVFGLKEFSEEIHNIEESASELSYVRNGINKLSHRLDHFLYSYNRLLGISKDTLKEKFYTLSKHQLNSLKQKTADATSLKHSQAIVDQFIQDASYIEAETIFSHVGQSCVDLGKRLGKKVQVSFVGGDIRLPSEYNEIYNSFVHLFRNSVDHGIEKVSERHGKKEIGTITMSFSQDPTHYLISISDDGSGISLDAIKRKIDKTGLLTHEEWNKLSKQKQLNIIFESGFSTRDDVTLTSGRGIGLDVVKEAVVNVGGTIVAFSEVGKGTTFDIKLPKLNRSLIAA